MNNPIIPGYVYPQNAPQVPNQNQQVPQQFQAAPIPVPYSPTMPMYQPAPQYPTQDPNQFQQMPIQPPQPQGAQLPTFNYGQVQPNQYAQAPQAQLQPDVSSLSAQLNMVLAPYPQLMDALNRYLYGFETKEQNYQQAIQTRDIALAQAQAESTAYGEQVKNLAMRVSAPNFATNPATPFKDHNEYMNSLKLESVVAPNQPVPGQPQQAPAGPPPMLQQPTGFMRGVIE